MLYRLPQTELMLLSTIPCPVSEARPSQKVIAASKSLRHFLKKVEKKSCANCPLASKCQLKDKPGDEASSLMEVSTVLAGLYFKQEDEAIKVYNAATVIAKTLEDIFVDLI
jgi:hypothetical protein